MRWDEPAPTVTRNLMCASSDNKLHPDQNRTLSPAEALVIQTVAGYEYDWGESPTDKELGDAFGEAVPPLFLEQAARHFITVSGNGSAARQAMAKRRSRRPERTEEKRSRSIQAYMAPHGPDRDDRDIAPDRPKDARNDPRHNPVRGRDLQRV